MSAACHAPHLVVYHLQLKHISPVLLHMHDKKKKKKKEDYK